MFGVSSGEKEQLDLEALLLQKCKFYQFYLFFFFFSPQQRKLSWVYNKIIATYLVVLMNEKSWKE